jgi:hypothetical protein
VVGCGRILEAVGLGAALNPEERPKPRGTGGWPRPVGQHAARMRLEIGHRKVEPVRCVNENDA